MASREQRKIRHWLDSEFSIMHIYLLVVMWLLTKGWLPHTIVGILIFLNATYGLKRILWLAKADKDYLKIPPTPSTSDKEGD